MTEQHGGKTWVERQAERAFRAVVAGLAVDAVYRGFGWAKRAARENDERDLRERNR